MVRRKDVNLEISAHTLSYDIDVMKILVLIIAVLIYIQPSLAGGCDMQMDRQDMQISLSMDECFDSTHEADPADNCEHSMHCGVCVSGTVILSQGISSFDLLANSATPVLAAAPLLLPPSSPPFRPPIS